MNFSEIFLIAIAVSMDAFAVSICKGLAMKKMETKNAIKIGLYFGIFQAGMPIIGYLLGKQFEEFVQSIDHWIAFILLSFIGLEMIKESFENDKENENDKLDFKTMLILSIATSIDALTIGITYAFFKVNIIQASSIIGITTFAFSVIGVFIGNKFGAKFKNQAEIIGGIILILIGLKILLEHLGILKI